MIAVQSLPAFASALVHPDAAVSPIERERHRAFINQRLAVSAFVLAAAPFALVFGNVPSPTQAALFALGLAPLGAAVVVAKTGRILIGHAIVVAALFCTAGLLRYAAHVEAGCCLVWLMLAQVEAAQSSNVRFARWTGLGVAASVVGALLLASGGTLTGTLTIPTAGAMAAALCTIAMVATIVRTARLVRSDARAHEDRYDAIAATFGDIVVGFDPQGSVAHVSASGPALLGVAAQDILGRGLFDLVHVADRPRFLKLIGDAAHCGETMTTTLRVRTHKAAADAGVQHLRVEMRARRLGASAGMDRDGLDRDGAAEVVAVLRDVSAVQDHAAEAEKAQSSMDGAIRSKDQFLANMSHELRTPLNAIIGFSEMLGSHTLRPSDPEKQREYARIIFQSGQHLLSVVNSILDMSKLQSGTFTITPDAFELQPLIEQCCDMVSLKAREGGIEIQRDVPDGLEEIVGDKRACKQIFLNLLSNAVKFTPANGRVAIKARAEGNGMRIEITDTGIGIAGEDLAKLGEPFFQAGSALSRPYEGTGLGLSVVRGLVGLHGGAILVESRLSEGTCVVVKLPLDCRVAAGKGQTAAVSDIFPRIGTTGAPWLPHQQSRIRKIA